MSNLTRKDHVIIAAGISALLFVAMTILVFGMWVLGDWAFSKDYPRSPPIFLIANRTASGDFALASPSEVSSNEMAVLSRIHP